MTTGKLWSGQWHVRKHVRSHFRVAEWPSNRVPRLLVPNRGPPHFAALYRRSTERTRAMRPSGPRITESHSIAKGGRAHYLSRCLRL